MNIVWIAGYENTSPVRLHDKHDTKRGREGKERLLARVLSFVRSGHDSTRRNRWRNEANDSKLQSCDSQENSRDNAQSDCSKMVGFASPRSLRWFSRRSRWKTLQNSIKREHPNVSRRGAPHNITLCEAHFQLPLLIIIAQSLKPLNLLCTKDTSKSI